MNNSLGETASPAPRLPGLEDNRPENVFSFAGGDGRPASSFFDLGFARVDTGRLSRRGFPEVIFCSGKLPEQVVAISRTLLDADGVAGIHRLLAVRDRLEASTTVIVVAGMEGALPSAVAGLISKPIIAAPTSIGYGANFGGIAALLGMLNSCGSGVTVVNIDNGFGAAYAAASISRLLGLQLGKQKSVQ